MHAKKEREKKKSVFILSTTYINKRLCELWHFDWRYA